MNISIPEKLLSSLGVPQLVDVYSQLPVNKNYSWGDLAGWRKAEDLTTIAIHHDYYPKAKRAHLTPMQMMTEIANDHIKSTKNEKNGDAGFPYHFYIMRGQIFYTNPIAARTYGVANNNGYTIHVCVHGDYYQSDSLTDADLNCIIAVCIMLKGLLPTVQAVKGHGELNPSKCPGFDMNRVRNELQKAEMQMVYAESAEKAKAVAYEIANQVLFLYNMAQGKMPDGSAATPGQMEWAKQMLLELAPFMRERKLL